LDDGMDALRALFALLLVAFVGCAWTDASWSTTSPIMTRRNDSLPPWNPFDVNASCPRFVLAELGGGGLGDQLEHYVYYLYLAKLMEATMVVDGFVQGGFDLQHRMHAGATEYAWIAEHLLGVNTRWNVSYVKATYRPTERAVSYDDAVAAKKHEAEGGPPSAHYLACNTLMTSNIYNCGGWCHLTRPFVGFVEVGWLLRQTQGQERCRRHYPDTNATTTAGGGDAVKVVWHVRTGDICLHCDDAGYYRRVRAVLEQALEGYEYKVIFEAQEKVPMLEQEFPKAEFRINSKLVSTVCNFITADVLVTAGSSFAPMASMFGGTPWQPIVFEARMKEVPAMKDKRLVYHYYQDNDAVLLDHDRPLRHPLEIVHLVQTILGAKRTTTKKKVAG
jgi:hypothetical protein